MTFRHTLGRPSREKGKIQRQGWRQPLRPANLTPGLNVRSYLQPTLLLLILWIQTRPLWAQMSNLGVHSSIRWHELELKRQRPTWDDGVLEVRKSRNARSRAHLITRNERVLEQSEISSVINNVRYRFKSNWENKALRWLRVMFTVRVLPPFFRPRTTQKLFYAIDQPRENDVCFYRLGPTCHKPCAEAGQSSWSPDRPQT